MSSRRVPAEPVPSVPLVPLILRAGYAAATFKSLY